jgi:hypothetical protein
MVTMIPITMEIITETITETITDMANIMTIIVLFITDPVKLLKIIAWQIQE